MYNTFQSNYQKGGMRYRDLISNYDITYEIIGFLAHKSNSDIK